MFDLTGTDSAIVPIHTISDWRSAETRVPWRALLLVMWRDPPAYLLPAVRSSVSADHGCRWSQLETMIAM